MFFKTLAYLALSITIITQGASIAQAMETNPTDNLSTGINSTLIESLKYQIKYHRLPGTNENNFQPLSYSEFIDLQNEGKISHEQAEILIDHAYASGNPILFRKSDQLVSPESYCLNFLWIHASKMNLHENDHLMGSNEEGFIKNILNPIKDWQLKQPHAHFNFWYDEDMITCNNIVIENTKKALSDKGIILDNLEFKSIRTIEIVKQNPRLFNEDIPVYFRVDFSKILTAHSLMTNSLDIEFVVNIDSDITAITCEHMFDQETLRELNGLGYVFGSAFTASEENSFIMLSKKLAYELHNKVMIGFTLKKAEARKKAYNEEVGDQSAFYNYKYFKEQMDCFQSSKNNNGNSLIRIRHGKAMILPSSKFGSIAYSDRQIDALKKSLQKI